MVQYRAEISYFGRDFQGFQSQPHGKTVQDTLEKALKIFLGSESRVVVTGASRTDTGVHAEQQFVTFRTDVSIDKNKALRSINALTPDSLGLRNLTIVDEDFHLLTHSFGKLYRYRIWTGSNQEPLLRDWAWWLPREINIEVLESVLRQVIGEHDFSSFANTGGNTSTNIREIQSVEVLRNGHLLDLWIEGRGFLKQMVRNLVGTAIELVSAKPNAKSMQELLEIKDRSKAGQTAPAHGLSLVRVKFKDEVLLDRGFVEHHKSFAWTLPTS